MTGATQSLAPLQCNVVCLNTKGANGQATLHWLDTISSCPLPSSRSCPCEPLPNEWQSGNNCLLLDDSYYCYVLIGQSWCETLVRPGCLLKMTVADDCFRSQNSLTIGWFLPFLFPTGQGLHSDSNLCQGRGGLKIMCKDNVWSLSREWKMFVKNLKR